jgi:predicted DNA-binding transcriptional regulator YafY
MPKKTPVHAYTEQKAFERLLLLIATILQYPGVGSSENLDNLIYNKHDQHHDALTEVRKRLQQLAPLYNVKLPPNSPTNPTLRKDLETLRRYGILGKRMYRWGYYLGTGAMTQEEFQIAFNALASQAKFQGDPHIRQMYESLTKRLRGLDMQLGGELFYPTRQHINRTIVHTDPEEMAQLGENQDTLFHKLSILEKAISQGQAIEISRPNDVYGTNHTGILQVFPLQLVYNDIAWYLLYEYCQTGHLAIGRLNRFKDYCEILDKSPRGLKSQRESLDKAYQLLENGWGLFLGEMEDQQKELQGQLSLIRVKVRFYPPATTFIVEGQKRHPQQKIVIGAIDKQTGKAKYVDYIINLPPRSVDEFMLWVYKYMDKAQIMAPKTLADKHKKAAQDLLSRY